MQAVIRVRGWVALVGFALLAVAVGASRADAQATFTGTWELDRFKSAYEPISTQPQRRELIVEVKGDDIVSKARTWRGEALNEVTIAAKVDGKEYPVPNQPATVNFKRTNAATLVRVATVNGKPSETQTWTLSADGKVLTITAEGVDAVGTPIKSRQHYDRK
jgi:hypothetical protein